MCKKQQHIDMIEQFCTNIVVALKRAASEVLTNSPQQKHNIPERNKDVRGKHKTARQAYLYWIDNQVCTFHDGCKQGIDQQISY